MIINLNGYRRILLEQRAAIKGFKDRFGYFNYYFDPELREFPLSVDKDDLPYVDGETKDTITGIIDKCNHDDIMTLINPNSDKNVSSFEKIGCGYKNAEALYVTYGDYSSIILDMFMYIKGQVPSGYQVILMQPEETIKKVHVGEGVYWGISAFNGGFLFSHNLKDNLPINYTKDLIGCGVKILLKDSSNNIMEAAKINTVYKAGIPVGISFEVSIDAITAARLHKDKSLYGSRAYTENVAVFIDGDRYREKLVDSLLGLIGLGATKSAFDEASVNFAKVYIEAIASVMLIRGDTIEDISNIYDEISNGLGVSNENLKEVILEMILDKCKAIIDYANERPYLTSKEPRTLKELAVRKEMQKAGKQVYVRRIKKPQV